MSRYAVTGVARELERATLTGLICRECGAQFTEAHGHEVACEYCWKRLPVEERAEVYRAQHPEANKEAHRREAKRRKAVRSGYHNDED